LKGRLLWKRFRKLDGFIQKKSRRIKKCEKGNKYKNIDGKQFKSLNIIYVNQKVLHEAVKGDENLSKYAFAFACAFACALVQH
jgi:hypothetical protein